LTHGVEAGDWRLRGDTAGVGHDTPVSDQLLGRRGHCRPPPVRLHTRCGPTTSQPTRSLILELDHADHHRDHRGTASRQFVFAFFAPVADVTLEPRHPGPSFAGNRWTSDSDTKTRIRRDQGAGEGLEPYVHQSLSITWRSPSPKVWGVSGERWSGGL
jgi:hypothetical protein